MGFIEGRVRKGRVRNGGGGKGKVMDEKGRKGRLKWGVKLWGMYVCMLRFVMLWIRDWVEGGVEEW